MLEAVIFDRGKRSIATLARENGIPISTAHRQVATLLHEGYLATLHNGYMVAGPRLIGLLRMLDDKEQIEVAAEPVLEALASDTRCTIQLGMLENDMVTYRIKTGEGAADLFTRVGMQLEAYCSAIGKVLLAALPAHEQKGYLAAGPFISLTPHTITDPATLAQELQRVQRQGFAIEDGETAEGLSCTAVPVTNEMGKVVAAISASYATSAPIMDREVLIDVLQRTSDRISHTAFPRTTG